MVKKFVLRMVSVLLACAVCGVTMFCVSGATQANAIGDEVKVSFLLAFF